MLWKHEHVILVQIVAEYVNALSNLKKEKLVQ